MNIIVNGTQYEFSTGAEAARQLYYNMHSYFNVTAIVCKTCKHREKTFYSFRNNIINGIREFNSTDFECTSCTHSKLMVDLNTTQNKLYTFQCSKDYATMKSKSIGRTLYYYIADFSTNTSYFKLGVSMSPQYREDFYHTNDLVNLKLLFSGDSEDVLKVEYDTKLKYGIRSNDGRVLYDLPSTNESFLISNKNEILDFIDSRIDSLKSIIKLYT